MTYPVKWFSSHDASGAAVAGAPVFSGAAGSLITVLDAYLLTGYGTVSVASLVVSGGVATATVSAGHGLLDQQIALIAGATPGALNGEQRITRLSPTTFTFSTTAADGTAGGAITASVAPVVGWEKAFAGTSKAIYRSTDPAAVAAVYRVRHDAPPNAAARAALSASDIDTLSGQTAELVWSGSTTPDSTPRRWIAAADSRTVWISIVDDGGAPHYGYTMGFGDLEAAGPLDAGPAGVWGYLSLTQSSGSAYAAGELVRGVSGGGPVAVETILPQGRTGYSVPGRAGAGWPYPSPVHGGVDAAEMAVRGVASGALRGRLRGLLAPLHARDQMPAAGSIITLGDERYAVLSQCEWQSGQYGSLLADLRGPW
ncbi:hypothetical protein [Plasticicumulans sp.]|uniref:hypothetical protein n=1 Tax=Plasticicumulans sp. TaxID=2307179 RepID=UPI00321FFB85